MTADANELVIERKMSQLRDGNRSRGRPGPCQCLVPYADQDLSAKDCDRGNIPIILNAGLPSEAALFGPAVEEVAFAALPAEAVELAPAAFSAADVPDLSDIM